ncbi:MAG TPA: response regulator [Ignavibacteriaceae bacterium]|nr:response regulator [Ignavibacteriaceae bacterium]
MNTQQKFIIVDDDTINNALCQIAIKTSVKGAFVKAFTIPEEGFDYLVKNTNDNKNDQAIVFLDLNMPRVSGWEFLDYFDKLDEQVRARYKIYILTTSFDLRDKERALTNKNVVDYIVKPLTTEIVGKILS